MPISFAVASHAAKPFAIMSSPAARGLTARNLLAEACPPQYKNAGVIRGTSFTREEENVTVTLSPDVVPITASPELQPRTRTKSKLSRLSNLFSKKKSNEPHSNAPVPSLSPSATTSKSPVIEGIEIPTTDGFASTVILDGQPAVDIKDINDVPSPAAIDGQATRNLPAPTPTRSTIPERSTDADEFMVKNVFPRPNGFVDTIISAYNQHHALILRPDDVWITILTQFNFYVNAHAELLRANFVAHEGTKALTVSTASFDDFGRLAREMVSLIEKNIVDPTLRAWALPDFSTTTVNDTTVSSIVLMATLKAYFEHAYCDVCCGIPRVTLEGERRDWEKLLQRLEKLKEYGLETVAWYHLLVPVLSRFVTAFDNPNGKSNVEFWQNVAHFEPGGSGPSYYSGWITAFCAFNDKGDWLGPRLNPDIESSAAPESLPASEFWKTYGGCAASGLTLDGTRFHKIDCDNVPPSYAEVDCSMTAGVVGTRVSSSNDSGLSPSGKDDTIRPAIGWWLFNQK
ncbi:hypothetical protein B0H13DRAFT_2075329 [Mycena leptocephala]|nr:hypothetical protein B0H13DRAFT_2075329 [Mycena leptocephala]